MHRARMFYLRLVHYSHLSLSIPQSWRESCTEFLASRSQKKLKNYAPMGICVDCETEASRCIAEYPSNINQQRSTKRNGCVDAVIEVNFQIYNVPERARSRSKLT